MIRQRGNKLATTQASEPLVGASLLKVRRRFLTFPTA